MHPIGRPILVLTALLACNQEKGAEPPAEGSPHQTQATAPATPSKVAVAGASDLVFVMDDLIPRFEKQTGIAVTFIPGSSGQLAAQIREGAPYDVFFSANVKFVDDVIAAGSCDPATKALYARGRIVLWAGPEADAVLPDDLNGLTDERYQRIAIADPDHAPYGTAAKQAMQKLGVWDAIEKRIVYGNNIKATMQFIETNNAEIGVIALSLAKKSPGKHVVIPPELHKPIDQAMVVCTEGPSQAGGRKFAEFMASPEARAVMSDYGFQAP